MNSLNFSGDYKKDEKTPKLFTPNIYRKPITSNEHEKEGKRTASHSGPHNYVPENAGEPCDDEKETIYRIPASDIDELVQKEALLSEIKKRYESEISEYEEKQKEISELKNKFAQQEKELREKCAILKAATEKTKKSIPREQTEKLEKEISAFEERRLEYEKRLKEFEASRSEYEKELSNHKIRMEELEQKKAAYENDLEQHTKKRSELDEKRRSLEEMISSGEQFTIELNDISYPAVIEEIKSGYYEQLQALNRKRADIETLKSELEDEEEFLAQKRFSIEKAKENIHKELLELGPKTVELDAAIVIYEESVKNHQEKELAFEEKIKAFEKKKIELNAEAENLELQHLQTLKSHEEKEMVLQQRMKDLEQKKAELEGEEENIRSRREDNSRKEEDIKQSLSEMEARRSELERMIGKTNEEIGVHVTIHRQHLDIKKLNNKLEQQLIYIQSLESSVADLKRSLEEAKCDVKKNEVFSQILKQNIELIG
ncbi:MAG: hypothetical protein QCH31_03860 [Methanolobus sp.]|nr:hypothetical protein [Methanolobus sp.]